MPNSASVDALFKTLASPLSITTSSRAVPGDLFWIATDTESAVDAKVSGTLPETLRG